MLTTEPLFSADLQHDERLDAPMIAIAQQQNIRAMMVLPLQVGQRLLGVLLLQSEEIHQFTPRQVQFYLSLSPQIAVALDNQRLLTETRVALAEVEATQRRYTVQAWETYRSKLVTLSYEQVREGVPALDDNLLPTINQLMPQEQLADRASTGQREITRPHALISHHLLEQTEHQPDSGSSLVVPLTIRGEPIGVLGLQEIDHQRVWSPEEIALIEAISEQLAQAAENIRLIDETQQRAAREQIARQIADKVRASRDIEGALKTAAEELAKNLGVARAVIDLRMAPTDEPDEQLMEEQ
ncbi:MAG: GAF domain-containing protein [Anaerolineales bacterium]|nr:GAF domain-containing protein [Anaerolineales bacterium]